MSYEEIDKSVYGKDVFTNGAEGRYAKAKPTPEPSVKTGEKKKRAPKIPSTVGDDPSELSYENRQTDEGVKTKKKSRKNGETQNEDEISQSVLSADSEAVVKSKKKRGTKAESNTENIDPIPTTDVEVVKKKKTKASKSTPTEDDYQLIDSSTINELEPSTAMTPKVKKPKKHKTPKTPTDTFDGTQADNYSEYTNSGIYLLKYIYVLHFRKLNTFTTNSSS